MKKTTTLILGMLITIPTLQAEEKDYASLKAETIQQERDIRAQIRDIRADASDDASKHLSVSNISLTQRAEHIRQLQLRHRAELLRRY